MGVAIPEVGFCRAIPPCSDDVDSLGADVQLPDDNVGFDFNRLADDVISSDNAGFTSLLCQIVRWGRRPRLP